MSDVEVDLESLRRTVRWLDDHVVAGADDFRRTVTRLRADTSEDEWSDVPSAAAFAVSYRDAVTTLADVGRALAAGAAHLRDALGDNVVAYDAAEQRAQHRFDHLDRRADDPGGQAP